jgi:outer membrane lipoprotein-sorting protein/thiol-disulfide isomerase/thioredoxin
MRRSWLAGILGLSVLAAAAQAQTPQAGAVLNRMSSAYRSMQSYRDTATWTRKIGSKETTATVTLAAQRPNKFLLEIKGDKMNTVVVSDGSSLIALRPDRKAYTKTRAPFLLMKNDFLTKVDVPSPGARIISILLSATLRESDSALAKSMAAAEVSGPQSFGAKMGYVLTFRYDEDHDAKVYVTDGDYLVRKVSLISGSAADVVETHNDIEVDKPIPADTFTRALPTGAQLVFNLPPLERVEVATGGTGGAAPDFTAEAYGGGTFKLSDYKGKVVILDFWATWCGPCQRSMPHVQRVYDAVKDQDVVVIGLCVWDDKSAYEQWVPDNSSKYTFKFAFDPAGKSTNSSIAKRLFGVTGIPTTVIIDKEGNIVDSVVGYGDNDTRIEKSLHKVGITVTGAG